MISNLMGLAGGLSLILLYYMAGYWLSAKLCNRDMPYFGFFVWMMWFFAPVLVLIAVIGEQA